MKTFTIFFVPIGFFVLLMLLFFSTGDSTPVPMMTRSYKLIIVKESGFYNIYTFHTLEAASTASEYLKNNIDSGIKEKIIAD